MQRKRKWEEEKDAGMTDAEKAAVGAAAEVCAVRSSVYSAAVDRGATFDEHGCDDVSQ